MKEAPNTFEVLYPGAFSAKPPLTPAEMKNIRETGHPVLIVGEGNEFVDHANGKRLDGPFEIWQLPDNRVVIGWGKSNDPNWAFPVLIDIAKQEEATVIEDPPNARMGRNGG